MLAPLPYEHDTLLFCQPEHAEAALSALEDGFDQVVAVCINGHVDDQGAAAVKAANTVLDNALRLDVPLFVDARCVSDLGSLDFTPFSGAVCNANQVKYLRKSMDSEATVVVDAGISRHDAMTGAEVGADAVLFQQKADQVAAELYPIDDEGPQDVANLYAWWEQLMEPPAILDIDSLDETPNWISHVEFVAVQATLA